MNIDITRFNNEGLLNVYVAKLHCEYNANCVGCPYYKLDCMKTNVYSIINKVKINELEEEILTRMNGLKTVL